MIEPKSPFPGPVPLSEEDGLFAAERLASTAKLIDRLAADRIVLLYSPSGAGKSSLLNAGLIPAMKHRGAAVRPTIRVSIPNPDRPGTNRYTRSCAESLEIPMTGTTLGDCLGAPSDDELLVFDQFEEILTSDPRDEEGRIEFFRQLGEALRRPGRFAVFAVSEDYLASLDQYVIWIPGQLTSRMRIDILTAAGAEEQIRGAVASRPPVTIDDEAVDALVKDLSINGRVEPIQLQAVCARFWQALPDGTTRIGRASLRLSEKTLENYYAAAVVKAAEESGVSQRRIRDWFDALILTNSAGQATRVSAIDDPNSKSTAGLADTVVTVLEAAKLIRSDSRGGVTWRELAHDRLIEPVRRNNLDWLRGKFRALVVSFVAFLIVGLITVTGLLLREHRLHKQTLADEMAVISNRLLRDGDPTRALRVAEMAYEVDRSHPFPTAEEALINAWVNAGLEKRAPFDHILRHEDSVSGAVWSPDGSTLLTFSADGTAALWDKDGVLEKRMDQGAAIKDAAFMHDGKRIITVGEQHLVKMWDSQGNFLKDMVGHGCARGFCGVAKVAIRPDDKTIVTVGDDENVIMWNHDGVLAGRLTEHVAQGGWVKTVVFSPDGRYFATGGRDFDRTVQLYSANGNHMASLENDNCPPGVDHFNCGIFDIAFSPDGTFLLTASADPVIKMYDLKGNYVRSFTGHTSTVYSLAFSPDGKSFLSASADKSAILWNLDGTIKQTFRHDDYVFKAVFSRDGMNILTASRDKTARLWDLSGNPLAIYSGHQAYIWSAMFSPDEKHVVTVSLDKTARIWERQPPPIPILRHKSETEGNRPEVVSARFLPDGERVITATNSVVRRWDIGDETQPPRPWEYERVFGPDDYKHQRIFSLDISPDGKRFVTSGTDYQVRIWDTESGKRIREWEHRTGCTSDGWCGATNARYSPDGKFIVVSDFGGTVGIFDSEGNYSGRSVSHGAEVDAIAVSPGNKYLVTGSNDADIKLWDFQTAALLKTLQGHRKKVDWVTFSKSGDRILSGSADRTVKIRDLNGNILLNIPDAHADEIRSVEFSPDMQQIVSASQDRTAKVWDLKGHLLRTLSGHEYYLRTAFFSPTKDGSVVTASGDGSAIIWPSAAGVDRKIHNEDFYRLTDEDLARLGIHVH